MPGEPPAEGHQPTGFRSHRDDDRSRRRPRTRATVRRRAKAILTSRRKSEPRGTRADAAYPSRVRRQIVSCWGPMPVTRGEALAVGA